MTEKQAKPVQIPLQLDRFKQHDLCTFLPGENVAALNILKKISTGQSIHRVYIYGGNASGKTHLLQGVCKLANESKLTTAYIPLNQINEIESDMLYDMASQDVVCIDDLDFIDGHSKWQRSLTWLYNEVLDNQNSLIISGPCSPDAVALEVADLKSRLLWDQVFRLIEPDDAIKMSILQQKAKDRSFLLADEVIDYLMRRVNRDMVSLIAVLDRIDRASLIKKRKITVPFVKTLLDH